MSNLRLTRNGILKLTRLQGKFCECDIIIQALLEDHPMNGDEPEPIQEYNAIVSDATYSFPAIVNDFRGQLSLGINSVRVTEVLCCLSPTGQGILIINNPELVQITPAFASNSPRRVWSPNFDASRGNPLPIAALPYFPAIEHIPRIRVLVTYKSVLSDPHGGRINPMFIVHLLDESEEVRAYAMDQVALELYNKLENGRVYFITNLRRHKKSNEYFFNLSNSRSLELTRYTTIKDCHDSGVPKLRFVFTPLPKSHAQRVKDEELVDQRFTYIDVIGILKAVGTSNFICCNKQLPQKNATIFDQSGQTLSVYSGRTTQNNFVQVQDLLSHSDMQGF